MAVTVHREGRTIRGIWYNYGDSFTCQSSEGGSSDSEGSGSAKGFSAGDTVYYKGYATGDGGGLTSYPYLIYVTSSTMRGWFRESIFPYATYAIYYDANGGSGAPSSQTKTWGTALTLRSDKPSRTGYTFKNWNTSSGGGGTTYYAGGSYSTDSGATLYAQWTANTYTITYNANGGSLGKVPSTQDYTYASSGTINLSSNKPTKAGYTFLGWSTSSTATSATYAAEASFNKNKASDTTLYAVWQENKLTVNYYSNYATGVSASPLNAVGKDKNVLVRTQTFLYDNDYSQYGMVNYTSTSNDFWLTRTGYTGTGNWGTSTSGGTLVGQNKGFSTGQALAEAFGKSLKTGNASVNVYAQWQENKLTVTYYSNYADHIESNEVLLGEVSADTNVPIFKYNFKYDTSYSTYGLANYATSDGSLYMTRTRYDATAYWCTTTAEDIKLEGDKNDVLTYDGGIAIGENKGFSSGQELAETLGLTLEDGDKAISLYANWVLLASRITVYQSDGTPVKGLVHIYDDDGACHYGIITVYDQDGNARVVI